MGRFAARCNPRASVVLRPSFGPPRDCPASLGRDALAGGSLFVPDAPHTRSFVIVARTRLFFFFFFPLSSSHIVRREETRSRRVYSGTLFPRSRSIFCRFVSFFCPPPPAPSFFPFHRTMSFMPASRRLSVESTRGATDLTSLCSSVYPIITNVYKLDIFIYRNRSKCELYN